MKYEIAKKNFLSGANCAQSLVLAFHEECGLSREQALRISSSFGGGMGRLREVCGAVSGMFLVAGFLYGYSDLEDKALKDAHYARIQELGNEFRKKTGTIICRELLGLPENEKITAVSEARTASYYARRPCGDYVGIAAEILEKYISLHPPCHGSDGQIPG